MELPESSNYLESAAPASQMTLKVTHFIWDAEEPKENTELSQTQIYVCGLDAHEINVQLQKTPKVSKVLPLLSFWAGKSWCIVLQLKESAAADPQTQDYIFGQHAD